MITATVYNKGISANTLKGLKGKASKIANGYYNPVDHMTVFYEGWELKFTRINKKYPNNTIEWGKER